MRYWGFLAAKLLLADLALSGFAMLVADILPTPRLPYLGYNAFGHHLGYTVLVMFYTVFSAGVLWAIVRDHRYLCRTCLRRLKMPLATGSWTQVLLSRPRTEYICLYGHGTLKVEELQITGATRPEWLPNEDMWKELAKSK